MAKKRANGEGSIRKRKDGRWEGFYTAAYDPETGKQKLKNVLGKTQAEVKEKLKKAIADSQRLDMNRSGTHTVKSWVKMWYEVYAEPRLREKTKDYYLNYIDKHIIPELGDIKLDKLTTIQIQKFYNDLQKNGRVQRYKHIELKNKWQRNEPTVRAAFASGRMAAGRAGTRQDTTREQAKPSTRMFLARPRERSRKS